MFLYRICFFFGCLCIANSSVAIDLASVSSEIKARSLYNSPQWQALLHVSGGRKWITDENFLLSHDNFSFERELNLTLAYLYGDEARAVCRFPARYQWLRDQLTDLPELSLKVCDDLQEFLSKAPADEVALVFASENLKSPSSMMGHVFFNLAGQRDTGEKVEHSVSFFTNIDTWNVPKVFYESIVTGRPGHFALTPYRDQVLRYLHEEHRNVWRYTLGMSESERRIIQYHLFELRDTKLTYYFHAYNCATLLNFVVAHTVPELLSTTRPWVTPLDVVRRSNRIVESVSIQPSNQWLMRAYSETLPRPLVHEIRDDLTKSDEAPTLHWLYPLNDSDEGLFALEAARAYNDYLLVERQGHDKTRWENNESRFNDFAVQYFPNKSLDISEYKDPLKSPAERQMQFGYRYHHEASYLQVSFLPASHRLEDDNRQYFAESGLQIGELSLLLDSTSGNAHVDHFLIYGMQSFMPRHPMMEALSVSLGLGYKQKYDAELERHGAWFVEGSLGQTWRFRPAIDMYALAGAGLGYASATPYLYSKPSLGMFIRQRRGKLRLELSSYFNSDNADYSELLATQSFFVNQGSAVIFSFRKRYSHETTANQSEVSLAFKRYF